MLMQNIKDMTPSCQIYARWLSLERHIAQLVGLLFFGTAGPGLSPGLRSFSAWIPPLCLTPFLSTYCQIKTSCACLSPIKFLSIQDETSLKVNMLYNTISNLSLSKVCSWSVLNAVGLLGEVSRCTMYHELHQYNPSL